MANNWLTQESPRLKPDIGHEALSKNKKVIIHRVTGLQQIVTGF